MADRPQRHRRSVNHYSDDNPSTFTVKHKRGEPPPPPPPVDSAAQRRAARAEERQKQRPLPSNSSPRPPGKRGPGRPPNSFKQQQRQQNHLLHQQRQRQQQQQQQNNRKRPLSKMSGTDGGGPGSSSQSKSDDNDKTCMLFTVPTSAPSPAPSDQCVAHALSIQPVLPLTFPDRPSLEQRYPQLYRQDYVGCVALPSTVQSTTTTTTTTPTNAAGGWLRIPPPHKERWVPLQQSLPSLLQQPQPVDAKCRDREEPSLLALPPAPWTCFGVRKDDPLYFCVGDAAGHLLLYSSQSRTMCIQVVLTSAARREAERPILWSQAQQVKNFHFPNSIGAVTWHRNVAVAWTRQEVEILDVVNHSSLFCLPLNLMSIHSNFSINNSFSVINNNGTAAPSTSRRQVFSFQSLDLHPTESLLLWRPAGVRVLDGTAGDAGCFKDEISNHEKDNVSLYCIDFSDRQAGAKRRVVVPKDSSHKNYFFHASVWDLHKDKELLAVISQPNQSSQSNGTNTAMIASLCRLTVDGQVSQSTTLPDSSAVPGRLNTIYTDCVLEQYDDYLFLCTGRGIRCYETNRLTFLTVYGETVALHGRTVGWQACFWIPEPLFDASEIAILSTNKNKMSCWIQRPDELQCRNDQKQEAHRRALKQQLVRQESPSSAGPTNGFHQSASTTAMPTSQRDSFPSNTAAFSKANKLFSNMLLVGVPHPTRGPAELQSTLYVWKPGQVLPLTTLQTPPGGLLGLHIHATPTTGWRLTCATARQGEGWQLSASLKSDFAGTMYPVGYQIINDNMEYLEDEGELDQVANVAPQQQQVEEVPQGSKEEMDLQKALKQSLETAAEDKISVLLDSEDEEEDDARVLVPSVPDPALKGVFDEVDTSAARSPGRRIRSAPQVLCFFPQYKECQESYKEQIEEIAKRQQIPPPSAMDVAAALAQQQAIKTKGKRARMATVDAMLQASIDPALKYKMSLLHKEWSLGGSRLVLNAVSTSRVASPDSSDVVPLFLGQPAAALNQPQPLSFCSGDIFPVVTSSELSLCTNDGQDLQAAAKMLAGFCAACHERMVVHACGKRELPVDTEALEKAERQRKEQEEAEAKRARAERRRIAEAKRREARRKKKEEEERKRYFERLKEERRQREEAEQHPEMKRMARPENQRVLVLNGESHEYRYEVPVPAAAGAEANKPRATIPKFSELTSNPNAFGNSNHGFYSSSVASASVEESYPAGSQSTTTSGCDWSGGGYYKSEQANDAVATSPSSASPSSARETAATDNDALAALVGLADSFAPAPLKPPPVETGHYDYSGSLDRRSAILAQYSSQFKELTAPLSSCADGETRQQEICYATFGSSGTTAASAFTTTVTTGDNGIANGNYSGQNGTLAVKTPGAASGLERGNHQYAS